MNTWAEQAQNRSKTGPPIQPDSIRQKAIRAGIPYRRVLSRLHIGWTLEQALTPTPLQQAA